MRYITQILTIILLFIMTLGLVSGEIELSGIKESYFIGEPVDIDASVDYKEEVYGFFKLSMRCPKSSLDYFLVPILVKPGKRAMINPEPIRLSGNKVEVDDDCYILAVLSNENNIELLSKKSDFFEVNGDFDLNIGFKESSLNPGDTLIAYINTNIPDEAFSELAVSLIVDKNIVKYSSDIKEFNISYILPLDIKSGKIDVILQVEDSYGNFKEEKRTIEVDSIPSSIKNIYTQKVYYANGSDEVFSFKPVLFDQSNDALEEEMVEITIIGPDGSEIKRRSMLSTLRDTLEITEDMKPGIYTVISKYGDIEEKSSFEVINDDYKDKDALAEVASSDSVNSSNDYGGTESRNPLTGAAVSNSGSKSGFNIWKYVTFFLVVGIVIYTAFASGKAIASKEKHKKKEALDKDQKIFKKNEFSKKDNQFQGIKKN